MMPLADFVRMPKGSVQTYLLDSGDESRFLKKLSTYAMRAKSRIVHDMWLCVRLRDDTVRRMVVCKVVKEGEKRRRRRGKKG